MYGGGGYGSMYGGMGGMGGGMYGGPGMMGGADPNDPNSLTNTFSQSTQATFQVLESLVGAFGGVAQMLESTYMATHSSFFGIPFLSILFPALIIDDTNNHLSNGISSRTILQPPHHPRLHPRHLRPSPLPPHPLRQTYRPAPPRRRHRPHPRRLRLLPRPNLNPHPRHRPQRHPRHPLQKALPPLPRRRRRPPLPNDKTHPRPRRPTTNPTATEPP